MHFLLLILIFFLLFLFSRGLADLFCGLLVNDLKGGVIDAVLEALHFGVLDGVYVRGLIALVLRTLGGMKVPDRLLFDTLPVLLVPIAGLHPSNTGIGSSVCHFARALFLFLRPASYGDPSTCPCPCEADSKISRTHAVRLAGLDLAHTA